MVDVDGYAISESDAALLNDRMSATADQVTLNIWNTPTLNNEEIGENSADNPQPDYGSKNRGER